MDSRAWWATVHTVAKSWTRQQLSTSPLIYVITLFSKIYVSSWFEDISWKCDTLHPKIKFSWNIFRYDYCFHRHENCHLEEIFYMYIHFKSTIILLSLWKKKKTTEPWPIQSHCTSLYPKATIGNMLCYIFQYLIL